MAEGKGRTELTLAPEIKLARRLTARLHLTPPIDVVSLIKRYAQFDEVSFPVDVDGVCLNLKTPGKKPRVLINSRKPKNRRRFTAAHELGHIVIPWHVGSIIDETDVDDEGMDGYWVIEKEANRFASELLMPEAWVQAKLENTKDALSVLEHIIQDGGVSAQAARIRLMEILPAGHIVAHVDDGAVVASCRSLGTLANQPAVGSRIDADVVFPWIQPRKREIESRHYVWWAFPSNMPMPSTEGTREWRDVLDEIVDDILPWDAKQFKASINGIIAGANSSMRNDRKPGAIYSACLQRLYSNAARDGDVAALVNHRLFEEFIKTRVEAFLK